VTNASRDEPLGRAVRGWHRPPAVVIRFALDGTDRLDVDAIAVLE
jgi:hypothetical protein